MHVDGGFSVEAQGYTIGFESAADVDVDADRMSATASFDSFPGIPDDTEMEIVIIGSTAWMRDPTDPHGPHLSQDRARSPGRGLSRDTSHGCSARNRSRNPLVAATRRATSCAPSSGSTSSGTRPGQGHDTRIGRPAGANFPRRDRDGDPSAKRAFDHDAHDVVDPGDLTGVEVDLQPEPRVILEEPDDDREHTTAVVDRQLARRRADIWIAPRPGLDIALVVSSVPIDHRGVGGRHGRERARNEERDDWEPQREPAHNRTPVGRASASYSRRGGTASAPGPIMRPARRPRAGARIRLPAGSRRLARKRPRHVGCRFLGLRGPRPTAYRRAWPTPAPSETSS